MTDESRDKYAIKTHCTPPVKSEKTKSKLARKETKPLNFQVNDKKEATAWNSKRLFYCFELGCFFFYQGSLQKIESA